MDRGLGTTLQPSAAAAQGLAASPAKNSSQATANITDGLSQLTTYTLDALGRMSKLQTPDGGAQTWQLDSAGQPTVYTDPINRVTTYQYQYGSGKGDLTQITFPDGSNKQFQNDSTFPNP